MQLHHLSATDLAKAIRSKMCSARDAVKSCLDSIARQNPGLNAFLTVTAEAALVEAEKADSAMARGDSIGPLHGLPLGIKDTIDTDGIRTTYGSALFAGNVPASDDLIVARLRRAGAIVIGKTSTPEFGFGGITKNDLIGTTVNPYDRSRTCAGSSGGSAVAVAAGMIPLAHGTDFAGSIRHPASFCGVVGFRPSMGRIPVFPKMPLSQNLVAHGVFSRSVEDAALFLSATAGRDDRDPLSLATEAWQPLQFSGEHLSLRIGFSPNLGFALIDKEVEETFLSAIERISHIYPNTREAKFDLGDIGHPFRILRGALVHDQYSALVAAHRDQISDTLIWNTELGSAITAAEHFQAERERSVIYLKLLESFDEYDILATVSVPVLPFSHSNNTVLMINGIPLTDPIDWFTLSAVVTLTGFPAISIPCGFSRDGLPVGIQLIAKPFNESALVACAFRLQEELDFRHQWPVEA